MEQYIPKSALVVEIERRKNICQGVAEANENNEFTYFYYKGKTEAYSEMSEFLDTLEVKEVDLEKELDSMITPELKFHKALPSLFDVAKHFFELGMQQSKNDNNNEEKE